MLYGVAILAAALSFLAGRNALTPIATNPVSHTALAGVIVLPATTTPDVYPIAKVVDGTR